MAPTITVAPATMYPLEGIPGYKNSRLLAVDWSAYLPEFHEFWDEQNTVIPGPDSEDAQTLKLEILRNSLSLGELSMTQEAESPVHSWDASTNIRLKSEGELTLQLGFSGPDIVYATPILESVAVTVSPFEDRIRNFRWDN